MQQSEIYPSSRRTRKLWHIPAKRTALAAAVIAAMSVSAFNASARLSQPSVQQTEPARVARPAAMPASFADLAEKVRPAVVYIATRGVATKVNAQMMPPQLREFMERFSQGHQAPGMHQAPTRGVGSGFIVSQDGFIVTNNHVVADADEVTVKLSDGRELPARVQGTDPKTDLALLKIDTDESLPYVEFGDSDQTRVGDWVVAVGSPFGLGGSFSAGIVSARGRDIRSGPYDDFIQTDAPINRGNSGGPLFDTQGKVVGINTAIFSPTGGSIGIGFAVPAELAEPVLEQLKQSGHVARGWLGVRIQDVTEELAAGMELPSAKGALLAEVQPESPAAEGGLAVGDVVLTVDGKPITDGGDLSRGIGGRSPTDIVTLGVWRNGRAIDLEVALAATPGDAAAAANGIAREPGAMAGARRMGVQVTDLNDQTRKRLDLAEEVTGAVIVAVEPGGPAAARGLRPGDIVMRVGKSIVKDAATLGTLVRAASQKGDHVVLLVSRGGNEQFVPVDLSQG